MKIRVKIADQTFDVEVGDLQARPVKAVIDGETFEVWPEETAVPAPVAAAAAVPVSAPAPAPTSAPAPAARPAVAATTKSVVAPIPGTVIAVLVKEGDSVTFGQELITLEAMKMKSAIRANRAGTIAKIYVSAGDRLGQNQAIMDYGD